MLERSPRFTALGWVHGFTTRLGGVSTGRYATLNMGGKWGDDPAAVLSNRARVAAAAGFDPDDLRLVRQVHGAAVARSARATPDTEADAVWCHRDDGHDVVAVLTADCVPILLADRDGHVACAVHSGWRGTVANVVGAAVSTLRDEAGIAPERLVAAIGPCIERAAFEVGPEVAACFPEAFVERRGAALHVDLVAAVRRQLEDAGVAADAIERVGGCTHANPERYFSYRRDGAGIGQMMAFVGLPRDVAPKRTGA